MPKRKLTPYTRFIKKNIKARIETEGSAPAAMKSLAKEWRERKNK